MNTQPPKHSALLSSIRRAITHGHTPGHCTLCGIRLTGQALHHVPRLCDGCYSSPDDTGWCSFCGHYGIVLELTPAIYHCYPCLEHEIKALTGGAQ